MAQLRQDYPEFVKRNAEVVVVGPEAFARCPSWGSRTRSTSSSSGTGRMPAQAIVDRDGFVRWIHYGHSMSDIPSNEELLALRDGLA